MHMLKKSPTWYAFEHISGGRVIWMSTHGDVDLIPGSAEHYDARSEQVLMKNALADEGEEDILKAYFWDQAVSANLFFRLYNDTPVETDTLATLVGEVTGTGYAGISLSRNSTDFPAALNSGDWQVSSVTKTFTAGAGGWTAANHLILATVASGTSGKHVAYVPLSQTRTLGATDQLNVSMAIKLQ